MVQTSRFMKRHLYLAVTGTMGSGKSTAARLIAKHLNFHLIEENFGENAFLSRFYKDMPRWAFHSQTFFLMEKITQMLETNVILERGRSPSDRIPKRNSKESESYHPAKVRSQDDNWEGIVQDTPIQQDVFSYAKAQHITGNMDDAEWRLYQKIYRSFLPYLPKPTHIVYLKTSLEEVKKRIAGRLRSFEQKIPDGYLELLEMLNEAWMKKETDGIKLITMDTDGINLVRSKKNIEDFITSLKIKLHV